MFVLNILFLSNSSNIYWIPNELAQITDNKEVRRILIIKGKSHTGSAI